MADSIRKRIRALRARILEGGGSMVSIEQPRHLKVRFLNRHGVMVHMTAASTPSDRRNDRNEDCVLRKMLDATVD